MSNIRGRGLPKTPVTAEAKGSLWTSRGHPERMLWASPGLGALDFHPLVINVFLVVKPSKIKFLI